MPPILNLSEKIGFVETMSSHALQLAGILRMRRQWKKGCQIDLCLQTPICTRHQTCSSKQQETLFIIRA